MNAASEWRRVYAQRLAMVYIKNPRVQVVLLGGSAARGFADRYSDIELGVMWDGAPTNAERIQAIEQADGINWNLDGHDAAADVWIEDYTLHGVTIDVVHRTTEATQRLISDVVERYDITPFKQALVAAIRDAVPFQGVEIVQRWQKELQPYPHALMVSMADHYLQFNPWWSVEVFAERGEFVLVPQILCVASDRLVAGLTAINRLYYPGGKWLPKLLTSLSLAPPQFGDRLHQCFHAHPTDAVHIMAQLIEDTFNVAEAHVPSIDWSARRGMFRRRRLSIDMPSVTYG
jgi:predicted nucleotidyltransferase